MNILNEKEKAVFRRQLGSPKNGHKYDCLPVIFSKEDLFELKSNIIYELLIEEFGLEKSQVNRRYINNFLSRYRKKNVAPESQKTSYTRKQANPSPSPDQENITVDKTGRKLVEGGKYILLNGVKMLNPDFAGNKREDPPLITPVSFNE